MAACGHCNGARCHFVVGAMQDLGATHCVCDRQHSLDGDRGRAHSITGMCDSIENAGNFFEDVQLKVVDVPSALSKDELQKSPSKIENPT